MIRRFCRVFDDPGLKVKKWSIRQIMEILAEEKGGSLICGMCWPSGGSSDGATRATAGNGWPSDDQRQPMVSGSGVGAPGH